MSLRLGGLVEAHDDQPPVEQRELEVHLAPEVRGEPRGLVQIVAGAETAVTRIVARMEILRRDFCKTLAEGNRNGRFAANADRFTVSTKPVVVLWLPAVPATNAAASLFEYRTGITLSAGLGLVRHGPHESVIDTWILGSIRTARIRERYQLIPLTSSAVPLGSPGRLFRLQGLAGIRLRGPAGGEERGGEGRRHRHEGGGGGASGSRELRPSKRSGATSGRPSARPARRRRRRLPPARGRARARGAGGPIAPVRPGAPGSTRRRGPRSTSMMTG